MDGISFGGIYDAFDSFERQMEEGLADIFDEDDSPSVAVAASATQSFRSIIGCYALLFARPHSAHRTSYTRSKCRTVIHMVTGCSKKRRFFNF